MAGNRKHLDQLISAVRYQVGAIDDLIADISDSEDENAADWCRRLERIRMVITQELDEAQPSGRILKGLASVAAAIIVAIAAGAAEGAVSQSMETALSASAKVERCIEPEGGWEGPSEERTDHQLIGQYLRTAELAERRLAEAANGPDTSDHDLMSLRDEAITSLIAADSRAAEAGYSLVHPNHSGGRELHELAFRRTKLAERLNFDQS